MSQKLTLDLTVNGKLEELRAAPHDTLLTVLRDQLKLTGTKRGCNQGVCGACTVLMDGEPVRACLSVAANCEGKDITTVEGLAQRGELAPMQDAMIEANAVQCGFCTAGVIMTAHALLQNDDPLDVDAVRAGLSGNICRCSGYKKIVEAVMSADAARRSS